MITFIVVVSIICIVLFMLNKKGILGFVLLFGLLGATGSDFLYYLGTGILGTVFSFWVVNLFYSVPAWEERTRKRYVETEENGVKKTAKALLFFSYGVLTFFTIGSIFGQCMLAQKLGGIEHYFNSAYKTAEFISNVLFGLNIVGFVGAKIWKFYDNHCLKNHRST